MVITKPFLEVDQSSARQGAKAQRDAITPQLRDSTVSLNSFAVFASLRDQSSALVKSSYF